MLVFSAHARVLAKRNISEEEVRQIRGRGHVETPGRSVDRVNLWGRTDSGRRPRITTYRNNRNFVITVVAPDEETQ